MFDLLLPSLTIRKVCIDYIFTRKMQIYELLHKIILSVNISPSPFLSCRHCRHPRAYFHEAKMFHFVAHFMLTVKCIEVNFTLHLKYEAEGDFTTTALESGIYAEWR